MFKNTKRIFFIHCTYTFVNNKYKNENIADSKSNTDDNNDNVFNKMHKAIYLSPDGGQPRLNTSYGT